MLVAWTCVDLGVGIEYWLGVALVLGMMRPGSSNGSARSTPPPLKPPTTAYALGRDSSGGAAGNAAANASQSPTSPRRRRVHGEVDVSVHLALDVRPCIQPLPRTDG